MDTKKTNRFKRTAIAAALAATLVGGHVLGMSSASATSQPAQITTESWHQGPASFSELVKQVKPAVVSITSTGNGTKTIDSEQHEFSMPNMPDTSPFNNDFFKHFFDNMPKAPEGNGPHEFKGAGSGFIISDDGYIVTNFHVIDKAKEIEVVMDNGARFIAMIKGIDPKTDLALLKIESDGKLPFVEMGDSDKADIGDWVIAVGNQFGLGGTATAGIISARGRDIQSGPFDDFLQIDAPINKGNSGGPLFNAQGRVIGINTAIYSPSGGTVGIGFAIPSNMAKEIVTQLKANGEVSRGWLGVQIQPITEDIAESLGLKEARGALVASVIKDSPASKAGIKPGDVITSMDGKTLEDFKDLSRLVAITKAGSHSVLEIHRQSKASKIEIVIGRMPGEEVKQAKAENDSASDSAALGIQLASLTPETRKRYSVAESSNGVLVAGVESGSPASKAGIRPGYVINMVGQDVVKTPDDVIDRIKLAAKQKHPVVLLRIEDKGEKRFVAVKLASA
jgi:serine protease Do